MPTRRNWPGRCTQVTYLLTGGTGFIGSVVASKLVDRGEDVVLFDYEPDEERLGDVADEVTVVRGDVRRPETLARVFATHDVDRVVHLASLLGAGSELDPPLSVDINSRGTALVLDIAAAHGVEGFVNASSVAVFGYHPPAEIDDVDETSPKRPNTVYGSCKAFNEDIGRRYTEDGMTVTSLRFGSVYGPGRDAGASAFTTALIELPARGDSVTVPGVGSPNWLYVDDAAEGLIRAAETRDDGTYENYNLHGEIASIEDAADIVRDLVPGAEIETTDGGPSALPGVWMRMDTTKIQEDLGFEPQYDLRSGIEAHLAALGEA